MPPPCLRGEMKSPKISIRAGDVNFSMKIGGVDKKRGMSDIFTVLSTKLI